MASSPSMPAGSIGHSSRSASRCNAVVSSTSPTSQFRIQGKEELRQLNDRLANYIQRVQDLESERSSMLVQPEEKDESKNREMGNVRRLYEEELADVRKSLDELAGERARLQIDYAHLRDESRELNARCQKKESDLANALIRWREVEVTLRSKDVEYTKLLCENRSLSDDFTDLQAKLENREAILADTKNQMTSEILRRVEMENQVQTLREQLELQKNINDQEIFELRSQHENLLVEVNSRQRTEFESKLSEVMLQLRQDHESQLEQYKEEMDKTLIFKLENAKLAVLEKNDVTSATRDELEITKLRVVSLGSQLQQCQKDKMGLLSHFQELERTLDKEREVWQQKLSQKEQELLSVRSQMYSQLEDYESLLDVKLALDMEINAYRKMLEVEEQRLHISPSPSQHTTIPWTHEHSSRRLRGKKRKHEEALDSSPAYKMLKCSTEKCSVSVAEVDVEGKYVRLKNNSEMEQPLGGWMVQRRYRDSGEISFPIPSSCVLAGGQTLTIWAADAEADSGDMILPGPSSWGPVSDVRVILLNPDHEEMAECRVSMQSRGHEELEFDKGFVADSDIQHFPRQDPPKGSCNVM